MTLKNHYRTLEVELTATAQEIKQSYRKLAHKYHPDISKLSNCEEIFKEVSEAYAALTHPGKKTPLSQFDGQDRSTKNKSVNTFV